MLEILRNRDYRLLFTAQIIALLGTGLLTIALGLVAYDLAGDSAGRVLATALTIKMLVYISLSPFSVAFTGSMNRKWVLVTADAVRAAITLCLPFITSVWQVYILVFILQAASSTFTPTFQAIIPELLPAEKDYTKALSLSRLAYDLENIASPVIAGFLLTVVSYHWLFIGTSVGFVFSLICVLLATIPLIKISKQQSFLGRLTSGIRIYISTPRLRGFLFLNIAAAAIGAMVIVNTVVIVKSVFSGSETGVAVTLGAFGLGSMLSALLLPEVLEKFSDRFIMMISAFFAATILLVYGIFTLSIGWTMWHLLLAVWFTAGLSYSAILTPSGRLLRKSSDERNRPSLFAANFSLSHLCWLGTYPLAGYLGESIGMPWTMVILGILAFISCIISLFVWPSQNNKLKLQSTI